MGRRIMVAALALGAVPAAAVPAHAAQPAPRPAQGIITDAGYTAATSGVSYRAVTAHWTVPTVRCTTGGGALALWSGLDGYNTPTVEQVGVEAACAGAGVAPTYAGWYELYPAPQVTYPNTVAPGDAITATVTTNGTGTFTFTLADTTRGWTKTSKAVNASAKLGSAEVLAQYADVTFPAIGVTGALVNNAALAKASPIAIGAVSPIGPTGETFTIDGVTS